MLQQLERARARRRLGLTGEVAVTAAEELSKIEHIVILMMENHSYDNYFGMLTGRGEGFTLAPDGKPLGTNLTLSGDEVPLQQAPATTQTPDVPTQCWNASHIQWGEGKCDGFVRSIEQTQPGCDATMSMQYWTEQDLPFYYGLARTFPLATRWFSSCLGPTFPNRRFMISGTANGLIDDLPYGMIDYPKAGTIFDHLSARDISWLNYHHISPMKIRWRLVSHAPGLRLLRLVFGAIGGIFRQLHPWLESKIQCTASLYPLGILRSLNHLRPIEDFWTAASSGTLPSVSIVDPDFNGNSEENPQDIQLGEAFAAKVINAVMHGPAWPRTLLVWLYDEHGGYYDHIPPPAAVAPDDVPARSSYQRFPLLRPFANTALGRKLTIADAGPDTYAQLGFRVPAVIVSPYARPDYVTDVTYDHTAILRLIQRKWNLPTMTRRDAVAADLYDDALDLTGEGAFLTPPTLPAPALGS